MTPERLLTETELIRLLALPAGRELDAAVELHVFGNANVNGDREICRDFNGNPFPGTEVPPRFSTEFSAAGDVLQAMADRGYESQRLIRRGSDWVVEFTCPYGPCERHGTKDCSYHGAGPAYGNTLQLAVCYAALRTMGYG